MKIKIFKKLKDNKYKILLDNEEYITLYDDVIVKYNLLSNKELEETVLEDILQYNKKMEAYYLALKMLAKKMRTKKEIIKYLKKHEYEDDAINDVIKRLYEEKYLSDVRYIKAYVNDQINLTDKGPIKIKRELIALGFVERQISDYTDLVGDEIWEAKINKYIVKKMKSATNLSAYKLKSKIIYDLVNKGYYKDLINSIIENYEFKNSPEILIKEYNKIKKRIENKYEGFELRFHLKAKLLGKGFTSEDIEKVLKGDHDVY